MEGFARADAFFFITAIAVVVISIALVVALVYVIKILRDTRHISRRVRKEGDAIIHDVEAARKRIKKAKFKDIFSFFTGGAKRTKARKKKS